MNAEVINTVIDSLALRLAVPAQELLAVIPSFVIIDMAALSVGIVCFVIALVLALCTAKILMSGGDPFPQLMGCLGTGLIALPLIGVSLGSVVLWLHSPKAWAIRYILQVLKNG